MFTHIDDATVWDLVQPTRKNLADYLATLSESDWNAASLCDGWRVRDVLAHLILEYRYTAANSWLDFIRSGLRVNKFLEQTAVQLGNRPTGELLATFRALEHERHAPKTVSVINVLADLLVHEQDIRIPLGQPTAMDPAALQLIFSHWQPERYNFGERITGIAARVKGLQFVITDLSISKGTGPEVVGGAEDILLAVVGRKVSLSSLDGTGADLLRERLS